VFDLNDRQRAYLLAIFETDQEVEAEMRELPYRPFQQRPKASEWRWLEYKEPVPIIGDPGSALWRRIKKLDLVDQGTGSTFSALADRGLVSVQWHRVNVHGQGVPHLRMTTNGRKLARSWTGVKAYKSPAAGTLKEWHWRALAKAYAAGDEGLEGEYGVYGRIGERTWQRLLEYKWGALVEERPDVNWVTPCGACSSPRTATICTAPSGHATASSIPTSRRLEPSPVGLALGERS